MKCEPATQAERDRDRSLSTACLLVSRWKPFPSGAVGGRSPEESLIQSYIRDVPDFPKKGILFKDITPLLQSPAGLKEAIESLAKAVEPKSFDVVCGIESRGFIFASALAHHLGKGFVPIRKPGKLPWK